MSKLKISKFKVVWEGLCEVCDSETVIYDEKPSEKQEVICVECILDRGTTKLMKAKKK